jgi:flagellar motility protein MotE (MotC chaperone)
MENKKLEKIYNDLLKKATIESTKKGESVNVSEIKKQAEEIYKKINEPKEVSLDVYINEVVRHLVPQYVGQILEKNMKTIIESAEDFQEEKLKEKVNKITEENIRKIEEEYKEHLEKNEDKLKNILKEVNELTDIQKKALTETISYQDKTNERIANVLTIPFYISMLYLSNTYSLDESVINYFDLSKEVFNNTFATITTIVFNFNIFKDAFISIRKNAFKNILNIKK